MRPAVLLAFAAGAMSGALFANLGGLAALDQAAGTGDSRPAAAADADRCRPAVAAVDAIPRLDRLVALDAGAVDQGDGDSAAAGGDPVAEAASPAGPATGVAVDAGAVDPLLSSELQHRRDALAAAAATPAARRWAGGWADDPALLAEYFRAGSGAPVGGSGAAGGAAWPALPPVRRPFRFHVYDVPRSYIDGALEELRRGWAGSPCNRRRGHNGSAYTMLDWRHAHSLFTADVFIAKHLRRHPLHTDDLAAADAFVIPMMTHVYNCAGTMKYMGQILSWVYDRRQAAYAGLDGHDHFVFWWRWGMHYGSVQKYWRRLTRYFPNVNFISFDYLEAMGRNDWQDFSLALRPLYRRFAHSVVVPYPDFAPALAAPVPAAERHARRPIFFYFAGTSTIGGVRRWIRRSCDVAAHRGYFARSSAAGAPGAVPLPPDAFFNRTARWWDGGGGASAGAAPGVWFDQQCVFADFAANVVSAARLGIPKDYPTAMRQSTFCGHAAGDALSSRRPTSAVLAGCVPVLICDLCAYAWENLVDYRAFSVFVPEDVVLRGGLIPFLRAIPPARVRALQRGLAAVRRRFVYTDGAPRRGDALDSLVQQLALRGLVGRQHRRWFAANVNLSSAERDYPAVPGPRKRYVRVGDRADERDFNNLAAGG